jgi:aspartyl-tRNA(Asn)/glutamyl-tRNA(Gln) amidotransferase subunit A
MAPTSSSATPPDRSVSRRFAGVPGSAHLSSIQEVGAAYDRGLSPVSVAEECLDRVARHNGELRALLAVDQDGALEAARQAETELRSGHRRGPLHGIPVAVKDLLDLAGWPTTAGSRLFAHRVADQDAVALANLKAAGAIIIGKTNLHELATGGHDNPWFGKVVNPLHPGRGTGGSSSGSVAAVAAGFCVAAVGTDSGGSNRAPAAATGLVGFKPSQGLVDTTGCLPTARSLDVIGSFTATVADARLMMEALSGRKAVAAPAKGLRGLVMATCPDLYGATVDPVVERAHVAWFGQLTGAGVRVVELACADAPALREAGITILQYEFGEQYGAQVRAHPDLVGPGARAFAESALAVSQACYRRALDVRTLWRRQFPARLEGIDILAIPTAPGLAPQLEDDCTRAGDAMVSYSGAGAKFRLWANCLDMPAIALPLPCEDTLPASIQLATRPGHDWALLDMAQALSTLAA